MFGLELLNQIPRDFYREVHCHTTSDLNRAINHLATNPKLSKNSPVILNVCRYWTIAISSFFSLNTFLSISHCQVYCGNAYKQCTRHGARLKSRAELNYVLEQQYRQVWNNATKILWLPVSLSVAEYVFRREKLSKKKKRYKDISSAEYESICVTYKCMLVGLISLTAVGLLKVTHEYLLK